VTKFGVPVPFLENKAIQKKRKGSHRQRHPRFEQFERSGLIKSFPIEQRQRIMPLESKKRQGTRGSVLYGQSIRVVFPSYNFQPKLSDARII